MTPPPAPSLWSRWGKIMHTRQKEVSKLLTGDLHAFPERCSGCWADGPDGKALCSGPKAAELAKRFSLNTDKPNIMAQSGLPTVGVAAPGPACSAMWGTGRRRQGERAGTTGKKFFKSCSLVIELEEQTWRPRWRADMRL